MKKTYVIDTNVLIQSPYAIEHFEDNDLVIPLVVVEELDALKKADGEKGANARQAVRLLESYRNILGRVENGRILPLVYKKCRPNAQFDDDIGFLPGSEQEKIAPLMRPVIDNLEQILDSDESERYKNEMMLTDKIDEIFERGIIQTEALNFIRGRSIAKTYLIIDEAQNMKPNQVKGIITRAGKGTKIILLGDPNQIDKPFLDEKTNGLSYAAKYMKGVLIVIRLRFPQRNVNVPSLPWMLLKGCSA